MQCKSVHKPPNPREKTYHYSCGKSIATAGLVHAKTTYAGPYLSRSGQRWDSINVLLTSRRLGSFWGEGKNIQEHTHCNTEASFLCRVNGRRRWPKQDSLLR
jgi:hypothetical protein